MGFIVRAIDVGYGQTKLTTTSSRAGYGCQSFPSIAVLNASDGSRFASTFERNTFFIPINELFYEVGPEIRLAADTYRATQRHDNYSETPEYLALLRGALRMMDVKEIDLLIVGLPVSLLGPLKAQVEKAMTGEHQIGSRKCVTVHRVAAIAQPHGALAYYAKQQNMVKDLPKQENLVIDPGSRTFDWLVTQGMRLVQKQSYSINIGVYDIVRRIVDEIRAEVAEPYDEIDAIDEALRSREPLMINQKPYPLHKHMGIVRGMTQQAISTMLERIGNTARFQNIILVGGGAFLFEHAVKNAFKKHTIQLVDDPNFANVKGFQLAGEQLLKRILEQKLSIETGKGTAGHGG